jgi:hypothetical protein
MALRIALAWTAIGLIATILAVTYTLSIGRPDLMATAIFTNAVFVLMWALATPVIFRASAKYPVNSVRRVAAYGGAFTLFFVATNAAFGARFGLARLVADLTMKVIPAALAFTIIVAIGHWLARERAVTHVAISDRGRTHRVPVAAIRWLEAEDNYVLIHTTERSYTARERISDFESKLEASRFARVHRGAIVNIERVAEVRPLSHGDYEVVLDCGTAVRGSRSRRAVLRTILGHPVDRVVVGAAGANEAGS